MSGITSKVMTLTTKRCSLISLYLLTRSANFKETISGNVELYQPCRILLKNLPIDFDASYSETWPSVQKSRLKTDFSKNLDGDLDYFINYIW